MSWQTLVSLYLLMVFVSLAIGLAYFHIGLTLVLPFCGLEMLALGAALYVTSWRNSIREVVTVDDQSVAVEVGRDKPVERYEFQRSWTKVILEHPPVSWHPSRLLIRSHGRQVEVGQFLNEEERRGLAQLLIRMITPLEAVKP
ncbi:putative membrane protein [Methylohalomonas lacus]|uniref:Membrane protein n=2 Tax=Methylohalomonas lacus TaxID=398773 RepID=A0AAE3HK92_9GAMM|nr:putative membrane protein [Methylohalomonas lacus]